MGFKQRASLAGYIAALFMVNFAIQGGNSLFVIVGIGMVVVGFILFLGSNNTGNGR